MLVGFTAIRRREMGWADDDHPLVFLFLGSSGIGKRHTVCVSGVLFRSSPCLSFTPILLFPLLPFISFLSPSLPSLSLSLLGKTELAKQIAYYIHKNNRKVI